MPVRRAIGIWYMFVQHVPYLYPIIYPRFSLVLCYILRRPSQIFLTAVASIFDGRRTKRISCIWTIRVAVLDDYYYYLGTC